MSKKKRGPLSKKEQETIRNQSKMLTAEEIAKELNRSPEPILKFMEKEGLSHASMTQHEQDTVALRAALHRREYWPAIQDQFSNRELEYFESSWIELMIQFRENMMYSEELQLKQFITLEILANRCLEDRNRIIEDIDTKQAELDELYRQDPEERDHERAAFLEQMIAAGRGAEGTHAAEYDKFINRQQALSKDLKATRDKRIQRIEDSQTTLTGFLRRLEEDRKFRERLEQEAGVTELARIMATQRFAEWHTYGDDKVDQPFLNTDTVKDDEEQVAIERENYAKTREDEESTEER